MDSYIAPRSVTRLEEEVAELEKAHLVPQETTENLQEEKEEEVVSDPPATTSEEETWKKRHGDLRRLSQKQAEELKTAKEQLAALEKAKRSANLPSEEEFEAWAEANPQALSMVRALTLKETATTSEDVLAIKQELEQSKQEIKIKKVHPDFDEIKDSDEFHTWAENQPASVQNLIFTTSADDLIWALNLYKKEMSVSESPNKAAARSVVNKSSNAPTDTNGKKKFSESQVQAMSLSDYEKNEDAIKESMKIGNFVYDLSGGAR
jgi:hypothetical protein